MFVLVVVLWMKSWYLVPKIINYLLRWNWWNPNVIGMVLVNSHVHFWLFPYLSLGNPHRLVYDIDLGPKDMLGADTWIHSKPSQWGYTSPWNSMKFSKMERAFSDCNQHSLFCQNISLLTWCRYSHLNIDPLTCTLEASARRATSVSCWLKLASDLAMDP